MVHHDPNTGRFVSDKPPYKIIGLVVLVLVILIGVAWEVFG